MLARPIIRPLVRPLVRGVTEPGYGSLAGQILALFAAGEEGAWYDPADMGSLYQNSAGTTPVTALGQPVGRPLDKSGRGNHASQATSTARPTIQARVNLLNASEDFTVDSWIKETGVSAVSGDTVSFPAGSGGGNRLRQAVTVPDRTLPHTFSVTFPAASGWSDPTAKLYFRSATKIGIAVTPSSEEQRVTFTESASAGTSINFIIYADKPVVITGLRAAQLELGSAPTTYQRVTSAIDYADVGAPRKIDYDGVDDKLTTTFPDLGTDVTIVRSVPGVGASILTGQTIGAGARDDSTDHCGLIIVNRALTAAETAAVTRWANARAGV